MGSDTVATCRRSRSSGKHGCSQAKARRKTCDDRTKKFGTARPKPTENQPRREEKSRKKPTKTRKKRRKIGFGRFWALRVVPGRSWIAPERSRDGLRRPNGGAWGPSWPFGPPCWPPWAPSWQPKTLQTAPGARPEPSANACAVSNSVRLDFSSFCYAMVERPNLNFRQPVQCFVHLGRSSHRTRAGGETTRKSRDSGLQNQAREPRNRARAASGERKAAQEPSKSPRILKDGAERARQSEKLSLIHI